MVTEILAANPKFAQADAVVVVPINGVERVPPAEQAKLLIRNHFGDAGSQAGLHVQVVKVHQIIAEQPELPSLLANNRSGVFADTL